MFSGSWQGRASPNAGALPSAATDDGMRRPTLADEPPAPAVLAAAAEALRAVPPGESLRWRPLVRHPPGRRQPPVATKSSGDRGPCRRHPLTWNPASNIPGPVASRTGTSPGWRQAPGRCAPEPLVRRDRAARGPVAVGKAAPGTYATANNPALHLPPTSPLPGDRSAQRARVVVH